MGSGDVRWTAIQDISRAQELMGQLQAVLLPLLPVDGGWSELARDHMMEMIRCYASALDRLRACSSPASASASKDGSRRRSSDQKSRKKQLKLEGGYKTCSSPENTRRRMEEDSYSIVTSVPYEDGHQWRKYGQKTIQGFKHQRSYFRCTYSREQSCRARKTVQQEDTNNVYNLPEYRVVYATSHTCRSSTTSAISFPIFVLDSVLADNNIIVQQHQQYPKSLYDPPKSQLVGAIMYPPSSTSEAMITYDKADHADY